MRLPRSRTAISVLAVGQSNMEGKFAPAVGGFVPSHNVQFWDWRRQRYVAAKLGESPLFKDKETDTPAGNLAYSFAHMVAICTARPVKVSFYASGGKRIEFFLPVSVLRGNDWINDQTCGRFHGSLAPFIFDGNARESLIQASATYFDVVIIHQGEANTPDEPASYAMKLEAFIAELRACGLITVNTPILMGHINSGYRFAHHHRSALGLVRDPSVKVVEWDGIETMQDRGSPLNLHASGLGLHQLGLRYAASYLGHAR